MDPLNCALQEGVETRRLTNKVDSTRTTEVSVEAPNRLLRDGVREELDEMFEKMPLSSDSVFLDVGCGQGPALIRVAQFAPRLVVGVDINLGSLRAAKAAMKSVNQRPLLVQGDMANLPFKPEVFSHLCCRLSLPYVEQKSAIAEMGRVLRQGGVIFLQLHSVKFYVNLLFKELSSWKRLLANTFCLLNGLVFQLSEKQLTIRRTTPYQELYQTEKGVVRLLKRIQVEPMWIENRRQFRVAGVKTGKQNFHREVVR